MAGLLTRPLRGSLNEANANKVPVALQEARCGDAFAGLHRYVQGTCNASGVLVLPDGERAVHLTRARILSGTGTVGEKAITTPNTAPPAATDAAIAAAGNIAFNGADATTVVEAWYFTPEALPVTLQLAAVASVATFPGDNRGVLVISANVDEGVATGAVSVLTRGTTASTGNCALSNDGETVSFNAAQVVNGVVTITYVPAPGQGSAPASVATAVDIDSGV